MALNFKLLRELFKDLAPEQIAIDKYVAKGGVDPRTIPFRRNRKLAANNVAGAVADYGDDAAAGVAKYTDDMSDLIIKGKPIHEVPEGALWTPQNMLKDTLIAKRTGREPMWEPWEHREGTDVSHLGEAIERFNYDNSPMYEFEADPIQVPHLPTEQLVYRNGVLRPHKNTALGRWYEEALKKR